ncbi:MAG: AMP-binding protein [Bacteroidetes bacterium]|nr:AMP-binding protein [Bacteroidota bacterium]
MFTLRFSQLSVEAIASQAQAAIQQPLAEWEKHVWQFVAWWVDSSINEIEVHTSGSTGAPKAIKHTKQAMLASAKATCNTLQIPKGCEALLCLPANKIGGMMMIVRSIYNRMDLLCIQPSARPIEALAAEHKIYFAAFTPMQIQHIKDDYSVFMKLEGINTVLLGGEAINPLAASYMPRLLNNVYATFGMTETISHIALKKVNGINPDTYYTTLQGITIAADDRSCLVIDAPALNVHQLQTNDIVNLIGTTQFEWLGRYDNVINTGGIKLYPESIELKLLPHMEAPFFITGKNDDTTGQKPVLVIEKEKLSSAEIEELNNIFQHLDKYERPREIINITKFIRTSNGKIERNRTLAMV